MPASPERLISTAIPVRAIFAGGTVLVCHKERLRWQKWDFIADKLPPIGFEPRSAARKMQDGGVDQGTYAGSL